MTQDFAANPENKDAEVRRIIEILRTELKEKHNLEIGRDSVADQRLKQAAHKAWNDLQHTNPVEVNLSFFPADQSESLHLRKIISHADLNQAVDSSSPQQEEGGGADRSVRVQLPDRKPILTYVIMGISILVYILQVGTRTFLDYDIPALIGAKINDLIVGGDYWRLLTPVVLHGSPLHVGFNMYALYLMGRRIERVFGPERFLLLYGIAGFAGNITSFLFTPEASYGASTAIFGLLGAEGVFIYQHRRLFGSRFQQQLWQIVQLAVINLIIGLSPGIDNWGHIGGLIGGSLFTFAAGPILQLEGLPPILEVRDQRSKQAILITAVFMVILLMILVGVVINIRS